MNKNNNINNNDIKMLILILQLSSSYTIIVLKHHIEERAVCPVQCTKYDWWLVNWVPWSFYI